MIKSILIGTVYFGVGFYVIHRVFHDPTLGGWAKYRLVMLFIPVAIVYAFFYAIYIVIMAIIGSDELFDDNHLFKKEEQNTQKNEN